MTQTRSGQVWRTTFVDTSALLFVLLLLLWADRRPPAPDHNPTSLSRPAQLQDAAYDPEATSTPPAPLAELVRVALSDGPSDRPAVTIRPDGLVAVMRIAAPSAGIGADDAVALVTDRVRRLSRLGVVREIRLGRGIALPGTTLLLARALAARFSDLAPPPIVLRSEEPEQDGAGPTLAIVLDGRL